MLQMMKFKFPNVIRSASRLLAISLCHGWLPSQKMNFLSILSRDLYTRLCNCIAPWVLVVTGTYQTHMSPRAQKWPNQSPVGQNSVTILTGRNKLLFLAVYNWNLLKLSSLIKLKSFTLSHLLLHLKHLGPSYQPLLSCQLTKENCIPVKFLASVKTSEPRVTMSQSRTGLNQYCHDTLFIFLIQATTSCFEMISIWCVSLVSAELAPPTVYANLSSSLSTFTLWQIVTCLFSDSSCLRLFDSA